MEPPCPLALPRRLRVGMDPAVTAAHAAVFSDDSPDTWRVHAARCGEAAAWR